MQRLQVTAAGTQNDSTNPVYMCNDKVKCSAYIENNIKLIHFMYQNIMYIKFQSKSTHRNPAQKRWFNLHANVRFCDICL